MIEYVFVVSRAAKDITCCMAKQLVLAAICLSTGYDIFCPPHKSLAFGPIYFKFEKVITSLKSPMYKSLGAIGYQ